MSASKSGVNKNMSSLILSGAESIVAGWKLKTDGVDSQQVSLGRRSCRGSVRDADRACHVCSEDRAQVCLPWILCSSERRLQINLGSNKGFS